MSFNEYDYVRRIEYAQLLFEKIYTKSELKEFKNQLSSELNKKMPYVDMSDKSKEEIFYAALVFQNMLIHEGEISDNMFIPDKHITRETAVA